jgi:galactonate dehydratase
LVSLTAYRAVRSTKKLGRGALVGLRPLLGWAVVKITALETFLVTPRWLFLKVSTDEGLAGWGEPIVEGRAETVRAAVAELADYLIGRDPLAIERHWQILTKGGFYRGGPVLSSAVAGIDQALWDLAGKARGVPVHELLGGPVRDSVRMYTGIGGDDPSAVADAAAAAIDAGFDAVKMNGTGAIGPIASPEETRGIVERVAAARSVLGDQRDLAVDFHGRMSTAMARRTLPLLEPYLLFFAEETTLPEYSRDLRAVADATSIPLATGERLFSRWDFRDVLSAGIAVAQPDLSHAGGISEVRRIAAAAETWDVAIAPHCPLGPIALAASLQVDFAIPNFLIQEQSMGIHYNVGNDLLDYLIDPAPFRFVDGIAPRPTGPGLGIEIDEAAVRRADQIGHRWRNPVWTRPDGSFTEW